MKKKLIWIVILATIITVIIYRLYSNDKYDLLILGDGVASGMTSYNVEGYSFNDYLRDYLKEEKMLDSYIRKFVKKGLRVEDLYNNLQNNSQVELKNEKITVLQAIANSNIIIISIGTDEIATKTNMFKESTIIDEMTSHLNSVISKIRSFSSKTIIIVGIYYSPIYSNTIVDSINKEYEKIAKEYDCIYIDLKDSINDYTYFPSMKSQYINYKGHEVISNKIIEILNK